MNRWVSTLMIVLGGAFLAGCAAPGDGGWTTESLYPTDVDTVAVPIWHRDVSIFRRDLETRLTEAIVKRIELDTPYKVTDKSRADTILEGTIVRVSQRVLGVNPNTGDARDIEVQLTVNFTWTDLRSGEILAERTKFVAAGVYTEAEPLNEDFFQGSASAIDLMSRRVVQSLEKPW